MEGKEAFQGHSAQVVEGVMQSGSGVWASGRAGTGAHEGRGRGLPWGDRLGRGGVVQPSGQHRTRGGGLAPWGRILIPQTLIPHFPAT